MKNKKRVKDLAEVYTESREVNDMLNLVADIKYDSTYLEPGCGNGNFLEEILNRKFKLIKKIKEVKHLKKIQVFEEFEFRSLISLGSIYGIDIDKENINESKLRLKKLFTEQVKNYTNKTIEDCLLESVEYILNKNIILGDFINKNDNIFFSQFSEFSGYQLKESIYTLDELLYPVDEVFRNDYKLFGHIPLVHKEFDPIKFNQIYKNGK